MLHFSNHLPPKNVHRYEPLNLIHVSVPKWRPDDVPIPKPDTSFDTIAIQPTAFPFRRLLKVEVGHMEFSKHLIV